MGWAKFWATFSQSLATFSDYRKGSENPKPSPEIVECGFNISPGEGQVVG
jgi:hypothetical protein